MRRQSSSSNGPDSPAPDAGMPTKSEIDLCRRCELWERATQGVPGAGPGKATIMLVGEQPGDEEDIAGKPFVGPAGRLLGRALHDAGIAASTVYVTNAVKHFAWEPRGKRRIHKTPAQREVSACRYWLEREITAQRPAVIVALGATALSAVVGRRTRVADAREAPLRHESGAWIVGSYHPAAVLRAPDEEARAALRDALVDDLRRAARLAKAP